MKLFLIGFMGSGKTTIGKKLARRLGLTFVDLDQAIEQEAQQTIPEIFETKGEAEFRRIEQQVLQTFGPKEQVLISTGGGTPCFFDNMDWMLQAGKTIYLELSPAALANRLKHAKAERPLIAGKDDAELLAFITEILANREAYYRKAEIHFSSNSFDKARMELLVGLLGIEA